MKPRRIVLVFTEESDWADFLVAFRKTPMSSDQLLGEMEEQYAAAAALWARERLDRRHVEPPNSLDSIEFTPKPAGKEKA
jgi:hypothetical protein